MDKENSIFKNGSRWLRADFHLHTRADKEFLYNESDGDFIDKYIKRLIKQDIRFGVITNHNKFDKEEFKKLKKRAIENNIGLLPGIEFSLKEGIHILIVFDYSWYEKIDHINQFITAAFLGIDKFDSPPYSNSSFDLEKTVKELDKFGLYYFLILAHIDQKNGLFEELSGRTLEQFIGHNSFKRVAGVQKSGCLANYKRLCDLAGREIACLEGSDNASGGISAIGRGRAAYIKIGDFNFDSIKHCLTDKERRISSKDCPKIENSYIESISFEGGLLDGNKIDFSPELNSIIGIRGSGKSSILEILRYILNIPIDEQDNDKDYKLGLLVYMLKSGGKVVMSVIDEYQNRYSIQKIYGQKEDIYQDGMLKNISIDGIFKKRPLYFGQKELSNKDIDFEARLINKLIAGKLKDVKIEIASKEKEIKDIVYSIKKSEDLRDIKTETEVDIKDTEHKLKFFEEHGLDKKLEDQSQFETDITNLSNFAKKLDDYLKDFENLTEKHSDIFNDEPLLSDINKDLTQDVKNIFDKLMSHFSRLSEIFELSKNSYEDFKELVKKIEIKKEAFKEQFANIKREINIENFNPDEFLKIKRHIMTSKLKLKEIEKIEEQRNKNINLLNDKLKDLSRLREKEYRIIEGEVDKINIDDKLSIKVIYRGRKDKFLSKLKSAFTGTGIRENTYQTIADKYQDFIEVYQKLGELAEVINDNQYAYFKSKLNENIAELLTCQIENRFEIKYKGKLLKNLSLGQRASALILFLLAQKENDILIIDQPEDDLDNKTIYEDLIKEIKKLKGNMQFIFATHNANIAVLGDSEKIISCNYKENEKIDIYQGTIDSKNTQRKVVQIMEGGKEAFRLRKEIYNIWNIERT